MFITQEVLQQSLSGRVEMHGLEIPKAHFTSSTKGIRLSFRNRSSLLLVRTTLGPLAASGFWWWLYFGCVFVFFAKDKAMHGDLI